MSRDYCRVREVLWTWESGDLANVKVTVTVTRDLYAVSVRVVPVVGCSNLSSSRRVPSTLPVLDQSTESCYDRRDYRSKYLVSSRGHPSLSPLQSRDSQSTAWGTCQNVTKEPSQKNRHKRTVTTNHHSQPSQPTATVNRHSQTSTGRAIGSDHVEEPLYVRVLRTLFSTYPSKPNLKLGFCWIKRPTVSVKQ